MPIRFKFRSSVAFDSVNLDGRRSISVGELRSKIIAQKKLEICKDFDLLISDAETGKVFEDDEIQIMEGSGIVIKRVPAGVSNRCDLDAGNAARKDGSFVERVATAPSLNVEKENFDDFGVDLYPILQGSLPEFDDDTGNLKFDDDTANIKDNVVTRCSEMPVSKCQNIEGSNLSEAMSKEVIGDNCCKVSDIEETQKEIKLESKKEVHQMFDENIGIPLPTMLDMDLPTELRCSLCNSIFKDAVMIPCCQHSFCEKCIRSTLVGRGRCPKCSSMKCTVEALLPNLSLRQAIEHFLEAQAANNALESKIPRYAPDVESGIHVKEVSCAMSIRKKEQTCPYSPSATGKGSNQVMAEAAYENRLTGGIGKSTPLPLKMKQMKGDENCSAEVLNHISGFHGVHSSSKLPQNFLQEEGNLAVQKNTGLGVTVLDGSGTVVPSNRYRRGDRTCYMCGSPGHLIRDCPVASNSYQFNQSGDAAFAGGMPGYGQTYWHVNNFPQARPYGNVYGNPGMMPFDPTMGPISPFGVPPYMSSMYSGMPGPYGYMRMGGGHAPMGPRVERSLPCQKFAEPHDGKQKHKTSEGHPKSVHDFDYMPEDYHCKGSRRTSPEQRRQLDNDTAGSFSDDDTSQIHKKHPDSKHYGLPHQQPTIHWNEERPSFERRHERGSCQSISMRDQRTRHSEKSNSEASDSSNRHSRDRKRHHHAFSLENESEKRGQYASNLNRKIHYNSRKKSSDDRKHSHRHHNHSEPYYSSDWRQHHKERESSHSSRSSRQMPKSKEERLVYERWEMVEGLDDDHRGVNYHKHRRTH